MVLKRCPRCNKAVDVDIEAKFGVCSKCHAVLSIHTTLTDSNKNRHGIKLKVVR